MLLDYNIHLRALFLCATVAACCFASIALSWKQRRRVEKSFGQLVIFLFSFFLFLLFSFSSSLSFSSSPLSPFSFSSSFPVSVLFSFSVSFLFSSLLSFHFFFFLLLLLLCLCLCICLFLLLFLFVCFSAHPRKGIEHESWAGEGGGAMMLAANQIVLISYLETPCGSTEDTCFFVVERCHCKVNTESTLLYNSGLETNAALQVWLAAECCLSGFKDKHKRN